MSEVLLEQETRRQAMLQVMGLEVWLPRQQLPHAASTPDWLLDWQPEPESPATPASAAPTAPAAVQPAPASVQAAPAARQVARAGSAKASLQQLRQTLEAGAAGKTSTPAPAPIPAEVVTVTAAPTDEPAATLPAEPEQAAPPVEIPRFSLQLLRSGPCLLLADLPLGEAFQSSDPDFQLLRDILRAAQLPQPQVLRQGEPVRWPLLATGALVGTQDAAAARACVRDLLEYETSQHPAMFIWLLGPRAMAFANQADAEAEIFTQTAFKGAIRFWNQPSLEQLMQEPGLKPQLWHHLQNMLPHWVNHG